MSLLSLGSIFFLIFDIPQVNIAEQIINSLLNYCRMQLCYLGNYITRTKYRFLFINVYIFKFVNITQCYIKHIQ